jgi:hypothetical protein
MTRSPRGICDVDGKSLVALGFGSMRTAGSGERRRPLSRKAAITVCCALLVSVAPLAGARSASPQLDAPTRAWMQEVITRWEQICRRELRISPEPLPWIVFYDEAFAWHMNPDAAELPAHELAAFLFTFAGRPQTVARVRNDGRLWVPGRAPLVLKPAAVAMPYADDQKTFFIVPLPSMYRTLAGPAEAKALDDLFLGMAGHELTHTRQLVDVAQRIKRLPGRSKLPESLDDNILQERFGHDDDYRRLFLRERDLLMNAVFAEDRESCLRTLEKALAIADERKRRFLSGDAAGYSDLEDMFLVMEGTAVWVQFRMARDRAPATEDWGQTLQTLMSRVGGAWSQEEGLALFLLMDRLVPGWQGRFMAPAFPSPFAVLREATGKHDQAAPLSTSPPS